jgi:hypothetical protein
MDIGDLKKRLQDHFSDGLVTVVGSGLSVAEGVPGMALLASHLQAHIPNGLPAGSRPLWDRIAQDLNAGIDLENALLKNRPDDPIESAVVEKTETVAPRPGFLIMPLSLGAVFWSSWRGPRLATRGAGPGRSGR